MMIPPPASLQARQAGLRAALAARGLDGLLVESLPNVTYLTGLHASAGVVLFVQQARLIVDGRYGTVGRTLQEQTGAFDLVVLAVGQSYDDIVIRELRALAGLRIGFEESCMTVRRHRTLLAATPADGAIAELVPADGLVEGLRMVKDAWEVDRLREGCRRLSEVAKCILPRVLAGQRERDVAAGIEQELRRAGFDRPAFDTIVAAGPNAALPHHRAGDRRIEAGDLVVLDFGGVFQGYCTDISRTVIVPPAGREAVALVERVREAHGAAIDAARPGAAPEAVDAAARDLLERAGLADRFTHGTGHGLGLEVHERPRLTWARPGHPEAALTPGMVFTVEPGVYLPGWGGVRIEDDVLVTPAGPEVLTGGGTE
ncbi:MAG: M24 family metallopeptidase [Vicinamibacterales bacterium]